jgi:hypothetical protein
VRPKLAVHGNIHAAVHACSNLCSSMLAAICAAPCLQQAATASTARLQGTLQQNLRAIACWHVPGVQRCACLVQQAQ